jgi:hypothetical protein
MEVRIRYLSREIAKTFGSSGKVETIQFSGDAKYQDVLSVLREKLRRHGEVNERLLDNFLILCDGMVLLRMKDKVLNPDCKVLVGYADTGG